MQTYLNQRKVLFQKSTKMIQDPVVNQHMISIIINKQINSLSTFCNQIQIIQIHNYNGNHDFWQGSWYNISERDISPAYKRRSVVYVQKCRDQNVPRPKYPVAETAQTQSTWPKRPEMIGLTEPARPKSRIPDSGLLELHWGKNVLVLPNACWLFRMSSVLHVPKASAWRVSVRYWEKFCYKSNFDVNNNNYSWPYWFHAVA